jgi:hypothetical protein
MYELSQEGSLKYYKYILKADKKWVIQLLVQFLVFPFAFLIIIPDNFS